MAFVERDSEGKISAIVRKTANPKPEVADPMSPELMAFLVAGGLKDEYEENWMLADLALARVVEDLVDILINKEMLKITDFPIPAQQKIIARHGKRNDFGYLTQLFPDDEDDEEDDLIA